MSNEDNCLKKPDGPKKLNRVIRISDEYKISEIKKAAKKYKITVNEALRAVLGLTVKEYAMRKGDTKLEWISVV